MGIAFRKAAKHILDFIFPPKCELCGEIDTKSSYAYLCSKCFSEYKEIRGPVCTVCGVPFVSEEATSHVCANCLKERPRFDSSYSAGIYGGRLEDTIKAYKYGRKRFLFKPLSDFAIERFKENQIAQFDLLIPVPSSMKKLKARGFDHIYLIANELSMLTGKPLIWTNLMKTTDTAPQVELTMKERKTNIEGSFSLKEPDQIKGKDILLIDDVYTNGSTLNECARVLKKSGKARSVFCYTIARTVFS